MGWASELLALLAATSTSVVPDARSTASSQSLALSGIDASATSCANATRTIVTTATAWATETASYDGSSQVTVTENEEQTTTVTITTDLGSTITRFTTVTEGSEATLSTYTPTLSVPAQQWLVRRTAAPACSATATTTATEVRSSTTTLYSGRAPTTTLQMRVGVTYTKTITIPASTLWISLTTSATSTKTVALAAPTFTQVFGPKAGCIDQWAATSFNLDPSITDSTNATADCKGLCAQDRLCQHVYVQHMFTEYGSTEPYYECYFNQRPLNVTRDLECGKREGTWGEACGFDAVGRGGQ